MIVMDNAPYHNIKTKESWFPKTANNKEEIIRWLQERGADVNLTMKKVHVTRVYVNHCIFIVIDIIIDVLTFATVITIYVPIIIVRIDDLL